MKQTTKTLVGALALTAIVTGSAAFAYQGDPNVQGPNYTPERHEAMTQAFENEDYDSWKELMDGKGRITQVVNSENFSKFAEAHKLAKEGNLEAAKEIKSELGLGMKDGRGQGQHKGQGQGQWRK